MSRSLKRGGIVLLVLAGALAANTAAGPLVTGWIDYPISSSMVNQLLGLEIVTVCLVVPVLVAAGVLAIRGQPLAPLLAIGPCGYAAYMFVQYVVGPEYTTYSFTVLAHTAITTLAGGLTVWCWMRSAATTFPAMSRAHRHRRAGWLAFLALFVLLRYVPVFAGAATGEPIPSEFASSRTFYWSIVLLDLGVVVPVTVLGAAAVLRGHRLASQAYYAVVGWLALVPVSVASMAAVMVARDDPRASVATLVLLSAASVVFAIPAVAALIRHRSLLSPRIAPRPDRSLIAPDPTTDHNHEETPMKAAVVDQFTDPLRIEDRAKPVPGPGQVLVRIGASGLCHTDIHAAHGDWPVKPTPPFVPGHEGVGIVEAVGEGLTARSVGDRVALAWLGHACGHCDHCIAGWETLCEEQQNTGYSIDGCFAEYAVADARYAVPVPDGVSSFDAAPLTCAGVTTYKAVKVAGITPTERVAVFGIGGLGHLAVQYARIVGATVIAVDIEDEKLAMAQELGADHVVNAAEVDPVQAIEALGGADVAIVLAVIPKVFEQAFAALRRGGRLVCVGLPPETDGPMALPIFPTVLKGISVIGSIVGTRQDLAEVFDLHARGRTRVVAESRKLEDVNAAIDDVLAGATSARIVFEL